MSLLNRKLAQEELITYIENLIVKLGVSRDCYKTFTGLPLAVQLITENCDTNIGYPEADLMGKLARLDPEKSDEELYREYIEPCIITRKLYPFIMPGIGSCYSLSEEMFATLEPVREFRREIEAKKGGVL